MVEYSKDRFAYEVLDGQVTNDMYQVMDEVIYFRDKIYLTGNSQLREKTLCATHDPPLSSHHGFTKTYRAIQERFSWRGLKEDVRRHVNECEVCERNKGELSQLRVCYNRFPF